MTEQTCAHPECNEPGEFPAPKSPQDVSARQYFCAKHIKEFNAKWNGLEGFSEEEIFTMRKGATWNRPTWQLGLSTLSFKTANPTENIADPFKMFAEQAGAQVVDQRERRRALPPKVKQACALFSVEPPLSEADIKVRYRQLAKKYHPDLNKEDGDAEHFKRVNESYRMLIAFVQGEEKEH